MIRNITSHQSNVFDDETNDCTMIVPKYQSNLSDIIKIQ